MNLLEKNVIDTLIDLKENHHILGIKAEFEDEGASFEEVLLFKKIAIISDLDLTVKIGGCGALNDINQVKNIGVGSIVAPMIESSYALRKFVQAVGTVYSEEEIVKPELFINIETISGYKNFEEILSVSELEDLTGIVVGRFDMAKSIGLTCKDSNGERIFEIVNDLAIKTKKTGKILTVGGGVSANSLEFFNRISGYFHRFETRKIIFDADYTLKNQDAEGILKAINFEIMWLNLKRDVYGIVQNKDSKRFKVLEERYKQFIKNQSEIESFISV